MIERRVLGESAWAAIVGVLFSGAVVACGGGAKTPTTCPEGTVLHGSDCLPDKDPDENMPPASSTTSSDSTSSGSSDGSHASSGGGDGATPSSGGEKTPYDKDAVDAELKRGARQVKANCGAATDDNGDANGPWGRTKASITLGRNGHVKAVKVPAPFDGTPVGECVVHAFEKTWFPPYAAPADVTVDWDIDVVKPKGK